MRIIHISDLHLKSNDKEVYILDPLFKDLKSKNEEKEIDLT